MTVRDAHRLKDKIEMSLDSRQIFFVFFGAAVAACVMFVMGVMVGRRLAERDFVAERAVTSAAMDPLAALDELGADEEADTLTFTEALTAPEPDPPEPARAAAAPVPSPAEEPAPPAAARTTEPEPAPAPEPPPERPEPAEAEPRFTLQLSSFREEAEATSFVANLKKKGYEPFIQKSNVEDKGIFFRVRLGGYSSYDEALAAKSDFEKAEHVIAYVSRL